MKIESIYLRKVPTGMEYTDNAYRIKDFLEKDLLLLNIFSLKATSMESNVSQVKEI